VSIRARLFVGALIALIAWVATADELAFDYRCGREITLAQGAPADGWTAAKSGQLPGKAGNPCWLRLDVSTLAPKVLKIGGATGFKSRSC
jgi:hypothetical protein